MIIVLLGYMGAGKSVTAKQLATVLNYTFIDLDRYIEIKENQIISEIFKDKGEIYFREKENFYLTKILNNSKNIVLALGGGTPCYANNMELINTHKNTISYYLQSTPKELSERLFLEKENRPLLKGITSKNKLTEFIGIHLFERQQFYYKANYILPVAGLSLKRVTEKIIEKLY